jgi:guanosine-3',5'-bis(diphosphate) 3'-pyrophosphohydrolase
VGDRLIDWAAAKFSGAELDLVRRAYEQATLAHNGQTRASGEPYVIHCVEVARMLADLGLDYHAVSAGFLTRKLLGW